MANNANERSWIHSRNFTLTIMIFGPRILSQYIKDNQFAAWYFDGVNPIGEKVFGATRKEALDNLYNRACTGK